MDAEESHILIKFNDTHLESNKLRATPQSADTIIARIIKYNE
jgi:hypothetical protein